MAVKRKRRTTRRKRATRSNLSYRPRRNAAKKKSTARKSPARKKTTSRKKASPGSHRPVVYKRGGKWYRSPNSTLFPEPVRLNPRRRRKSTRKVTRRKKPVSRRRRTYRRNPARKMQGMLFNRRAIMQGASLAAGFGSGALVMPVMYQFSPQVVKSQRRFMGVLHVMLGSLVLAQSKRPVTKNVSMGVVASGIYDLIAQNIPQLGLRSLPTNSSALLNLVGPKTSPASQTAPQTPDESASGSMGLSYRGTRDDRMGLSYQGTPDERMGLAYYENEAANTPIGCDTAFDGILE